MQGTAAALMMTAGSSFLVYTAAELEDGVIGKRRRWFRRRFYFQDTHVDCHLKPSKYSPM
jgi:hypothetical protein